ncbi:MAG: hypothetical protein BGO77_01625 [Caedibacter sp. 37-49]|nr:MAG: hypothetical protein BGO77_01625 [Caedibacter sp. 37-49]
MASVIALANPQMPAALSVPARLLRSCPPPNNKGDRGNFSFAIRAPTPAGPPTFREESVIKSTPKFLKSQGIRPIACAASV